MRNFVRTFLVVITLITSLYAQLPDPGFVIDETTAIVITDPQNNFQ